MDINKAIEKRRLLKSRAHPKGWSKHLKNIRRASFQEIGNSFSVKDLFFTPVIYFLECNNTVVYVGQTTSLMTRMSQHIQENTKVFTSFKFIVFKGSDKQRLQKEKQFIKDIKPIYNVTHN